MNVVSTAMSTLSLVSHRSRAARAATYATAFGVLSYVYFWLFHIVAHNSDDANSMLAGAELVRGNPLLKGWYMPPDSFYLTDVIPLGLISLVFKPSVTSLLILPSMIWAAVVLTTCAVVKRFAIDRTFGLVYCAAALGFPLVGAPRSMWIIARPALHITTTLAGVWLLLMAYEWLNGARRKWMAVAYPVLLGAVTVSDKMILFCAALPIIAVCFHRFREQRRRSFELITMTIAGTLLGEIALRVMIMGGFFLYDQQAAFAEFNKIGSNMAIFVNGLLMIFGADFTGGSLLPGHVRVSDYLISGLLPVLSRLPLVIGMVAAVGIVAVRLLKSQPNTLISLLLFYPVVIVCAAEIFSTEVVDLGAYRYSFPVLICGVTLAAITLVPQAFIRSILTGTLLISVVSFVVTVHSASTNPQFASKDQQALADFLRSRNLTDGYGPYWSASFFTVLTKGEVRIRAISDDGTGMLVPYKWLSESSWYPQPPKDGLRFVVYDSRVEEASAFSRSGIEKALGKPVDDPRVGPYQVMIYPANNPGFSSLSLPQ